MISSLHKHMQKHLITRISQSEMSVLIRTDSHVLLFTINNIAESAASNLHRLCRALYGPPQHQAKRHHSCPKGSAWGSYPCRMAGGAGGGKRGEQIQIGKWCTDTISVTHPQLLSAVLLAISTLEFFITYINRWMSCLSGVWVYLYETLLVLFWSVWLAFFEMAIQFVCQSLKLVL